MIPSLSLVSSAYFKAYQDVFDIDWRGMSEQLETKASFSTEDFEYYLIASSLYSSKIEGNTLDADSFFRNRGKAASPKKREVAEIEDLVAAYRYAADAVPTKEAFLHTHQLMSGTLLPRKEIGRIRKEQVGVRDAQTLRPIYLAVEPEFVDRELNKLFEDIQILRHTEMTDQEVFYAASMIHLWIALIHPFTDGNGRSARLLEKWFLVSKLGPAGWSIRSEQYYWNHRPDYYQNIALGYNFYALHWERCIPFLTMLPRALSDSVD